MVGGDTDKLYTLHPWTGAATAVGNVTAFGVSETEPRGLANLDGTLYMAGAANDALYTLNTSSGVASQVGSATQFGVSESEPTGISAHNDVLYMTGADTDALYTLDTTTGVATQVGSATQFDASEGGPNGLAWHRGTLYMVSSETDRLYWINSTSGVATAIGSATAFGVSEDTPTGIASHPPSNNAPSDLYMVGSGTDKLWSLDPESGEAEGVEVPNFGLNIRSSVPIASHGGQLYGVGQLPVSGGIPSPPGFGFGYRLLAIDTSSGIATGVGNTGISSFEGDISSHNGVLYRVTAKGQLYSLNAATGAATRVGSVDGFGVGERRPTGLASHQGTLYMVGQENHKLYTLDATAGIATAVGNAIEFGINEDNIGRLVSHNGTLYMSDDGGNEFFTLNTSTGTATQGASTVGGYVSGLASHNGVLYATVRDGDNYRLRILDITTGELTRIPSTLSQFGVGEGDPQGLASGP